VSSTTAYAAAGPSAAVFSVADHAWTDYSPEMSGLPDDGQGPLVEKGMDVNAVKSLVAAGESDSVEFKRSTAELTRVGETLCGFLNGHGGTVLIGVAPDGRLLGQEVSDSTLRDLAALAVREGLTLPSTLVSTCRESDREAECEKG
jgi:hypothetical protein